MVSKIGLLSSLAECVLNFSPVRSLLSLLSFASQVGALKKRYYMTPHRLDASFSAMKKSGETVSLDIGCGASPRNPFNAEKVVGADLRDNASKNVVFADLALGELPFESGSFDYVTAFDLLEHIQRAVLVDGQTKFPVVLLINEVFRVLKPGGTFFSIQPCFPFKQSFQDPTHVNLMTEDTLHKYFCEPAWARIYGYEGSFEMARDGWVSDKYFAFMRKSGADAIRDPDFIQSS